MALSTALRMIPSTPFRIAVSNAACSFSGEPSVVIVSDVQPRSLAPSLMMSPCSSQARTPQLMNASFLPVGTGLPIGLVTVIAAGFCSAFLTTACAWATPAGADDEDDEPAVALDVAASSSEPQPAATSVHTATRAASTVPRRGRVD